MGKTKMYKCSKEQFKSFFRSNWLTLALIVSLIIGIVFGIVLRLSRKDGWPERDKMYVKFIGSLFMNAIQSIVIPLTVPSLITAIGQLNKKAGGKVAGYTLLYYAITTFTAIALGLVLVTLI